MTICQVFVTVFAMVIGKTAIRSVIVLNSCQLPGTGLYPSNDRKTGMHAD